MAFSNRPILQNLFGQTACALWNQQQPIYVFDQNLSLARHFAGFYDGHVLYPSKQYPTERALSVIDEVQTVCEKTEALLLQGIGESDKKLFIDLLIQAGENITAELHIERKEEEFND